MIGFPTLRILHLGTNEIQTAEGIERIEMKNLYYINLGTAISYTGNNNIVSFRCIRKAYWPNLKNFLFRSYLSPTQDTTTSTISQESHK
jgi:hypothetical protein